MLLSGQRLVRLTALIIVALTVLRLVAAAITPLTFDEAYYWMWSKHLAAGYYDHPPGVALVIRLGTLVAGDTAVGVRLVSILLALPMSWAVYRAAAILFGSVRIATTAVLLLNATLVISVGMMIVTPDAPLLVAASFVILCLAKVVETGRGVWWLAVGVAVGAALVSKYTALLFGPAILIWLLSVPKLRRWFISPWPYLGGIVAFLLFSPVIWWNAEHQWVSFIKQLGRARIEDFSLSFIGEVIPIQVAFATPFVFVLGAMGLFAISGRRGGALASRALINATLWTIVVYFLWHALHARVEANWLSPLYPSFAIAAAVAAHLPDWNVHARRVAVFCRRWALPTGVLLFALLIIQTNTGWLTGYRRDVTMRSVGVGWPEVAAEIEAIRARTGATCVLAADYGTTAWLAFFLPKGTCVVQQSQRIRWVNLPEPDPELLKGRLLFVTEPRASVRSLMRAQFERIERVGEVPRKRGPTTVEIYAVDLLEGAKGDVLDHSPPPELE